MAPDLAIACSFAALCHRSLEALFWTSKRIDLVKGNVDFAINPELELALTERRSFEEAKGRKEAVDSEIASRRYSGQRYFDRQHAVVLPHKYRSFPFEFHVGPLVPAGE